MWSRRKRTASVSRSSVGTRIRTSSYGLDSTDPRLNTFWTSRTRGYCCTVSETVFLAEHASGYSTVRTKLRYLRTNEGVERTEARLPETPSHSRSPLERNF